MPNYHDLLNKYSLKAHRYELKGNVIFVDTDEGKFVLKKKKNYPNYDIYEYLKSRHFNYYPKSFSMHDDLYEITEYIDEIAIPNEQKIADLIDLVALLHSKTTHYKEVDLDDYKKIYEELKDNIIYLKSYYKDLITIVEMQVYMGPAEYLFARNINKFFEALDFCERELEEFYENVKEKRKQRLVVLHNNLELDHFIKNQNSYLINWDKAKVGMPIFDIYKLYLRHGLDYDFTELLKRYESQYKLNSDERKLLFILISLPSKITFTNDEYQMCKIVGNQVDLIYKTENLISPYYTEERKDKK